MVPNLTECISFAANEHAGQFRDGENPLPYITHPIDVLTNLRYIGKVVEPELLCTAVLHDVIEECGVQPNVIEEMFGQRVRELVLELTRVEPSPESIAGMDKDSIWELRSQLLLDEIAGMSAEAQSVKLADRLSNLTEARRTKEKKKLTRYNRQTGKILKIIPREANPGLWDAVKRLHEEIED